MCEDEESLRQACLGRSAAHAAQAMRQYLYFCSSKASKPMWSRRTRRTRRQYLYFCSSKASKPMWSRHTRRTSDASVSVLCSSKASKPMWSRRTRRTSDGISICTFVVVKQVNLCGAAAHAAQAMASDLPPVMRRAQNPIVCEYETHI